MNDHSMLSSNSSCPLDYYWELTGLSGLLTVYCDIELLENSLGSLALWVKTVCSHFDFLCSLISISIYRSHVAIFHLVIHIKQQYFNFPFWR